MKWILLLSVALANYSFSQGRRGGDPPAEPTETFLTINTNAISEGDNYEVEAKEITSSHRPGGIEIVTILDLTESDEVIITIPGGEEGTPVKVVFNIIEDEILNLRARIEYEDELHDTYFENEQYIVADGTTITIYDIDQATIPIDNNIFLALEKGLVFSPNDDGVYDELTLTMLEDFNVTHFEVLKLNGTIIYETEDKNFVWNGLIDDRLLDEGVYNYSIVIDDETIKGQFLVQY